ncbi:hypothetical protein COW64_08460 [bacterium (Candidatus Blackallbacteria) CG18_big_fil_WC_8_21_14_2_50_49_26]|nr:MAG: hypothetical protein COW64_08460 [bacterium (Candidatus Blackallbacteria) CG18_big_fil_WC_8_21_14_2_50_49_26]
MNAFMRWWRRREIEESRIRDVEVMRNYYERVYKRECEHAKKQCASLPNIVPSAFHEEECIGYGDGRWIIELVRDYTLPREQRITWRGTKCSDHSVVRTAKNLREMSAIIANDAAQHLPNRTEGEYDE